MGLFFRTEGAERFRETWELRLERSMQRPWSVASFFLKFNRAEVPLVHVRVWDQLQSCRMSLFKCDPPGFLDQSVTCTGLDLNMKQHHKKLFSFKCTL